MDLSSGPSGGKSCPAATAICYLHEEVWVGLENGGIMVLDKEFNKVDTFT